MTALLDGPWPLVTELLRVECDAYIIDARASSIWDLPTRCAPWTVLDITKHLAATFHRYVELLRRSRTGETRAPFTPDELSDENLRAVAEFKGDPHAELCAEVGRFATLATDPDERMLNQRGLIPVGLQMLWGLNELAIHHDDLARALGRTWCPTDDVVDVLGSLVPLREGAHPRDPDADAWTWILRSSGR